MRSQRLMGTRNPRGDVPWQAKGLDMGQSKSPNLPKRQARALNSEAGSQLV